MSTNSNWIQTPKGWVKKDQSAIKGAPIDWERARRIAQWEQELRKERAERNKVKQNDR